MILDKFDLELKRVDFCFDLEIENNVKKNILKTFFEQCTNKLPLKVYWYIHSSKEGSYLRIGKRRSARCSRIYKKSNSNNLRFELELKRRESILLFDHYLRNSEFENFEREAIKIFTNYWKLYLPKTNKFSNWLLDFLRKEKVKNQKINCLASYSYLNDNITKNEIDYNI